MDFIDYQIAAIRTAVYPRSQAVIYPTLGLTNEAGEVAGKVKKVLRDGDGNFTDQERLDQIIDELGDVLWYAAVLSADLGTTLQYVAERNISKLQDRFVRGAIKGDGDKR
jgi:NTP pyrophosphatase (non-canonical NTP hydrolase)